MKKPQPQEDTKMVTSKRIPILSIAIFAASFLVASPSWAEFCAPKIVSPEPEAVTSTTPTIQATAESGSNCNPNAKRVKLEITHVENNNTVYTYEKTRGEGLFTGRGYTTGMLLLDHSVPSGELVEGEKYKVYVEYPNPSFPASFDEHAGCCWITIKTSDAKTRQSAQRAQHTIVISGRNTSGSTGYTISGGGDLEQVSGTLDGRQVSIQGNDTVDGNLAQGQVGGAADGFRVFGKMPGILLNEPGNADIYVDGQPFYTIVISGRDTQGGTDYTISGGGRLEQVSGRLDAKDVSIQANDNVSGNRAQGHVAGAADGFRVYGERPQISLDQPANADIYVNGELQ
ncbi:hypothetical protein [Vreelandella massiliensis]|uniref:hypothetical protein n=1 Tax=Vreelandella massiliensis TaxID=1816686 RepID=UPI0011818DE6|nr:hypothetical protein [Halomonas massiliensis]